MLGVIAIAVVGICSGLPLLWLISVAVMHPSVIADIDLTAFRADLLARTLCFNAIAGIGATLLGLPVGLVLGRGRGVVAKLLWLVAPIAMFMPSLAYTYGWAQLLRMTTGYYTAWGISFEPAGTMDIARCVFSLAAWLWAVPACVIGLALRRSDADVQQQAAIDGALWRITLRQLAGPMLASVAIVTILATQEFAVYEPTGISVVATELRMVFDTGAFSSIANPITAPGMTGAGTGAPDQARRAASAVATAVPLLAATAGLAIFAAWAAGGLADEASSFDGLAGIGAATDWPRAIATPAWLTAVAVMIVLVTVAVPIVSLVCALGVPLHPVNIFTEFSPAVGGSYLVGSIAAALALCAAASAAARWTRGLLIVGVMSFLIGGQMLAIAMIRLTNRQGLIWAYDGWAAPVATYIGRYGWIAIAAAAATWTRPWRELRAAASLDGATGWRAARYVVWPLAWPTLAAGAMLVGALSLTEVPATVLLSPQNPQVLTPMLMTWLHTLRFDSMIEASLLMVAMVVVPVSIAAALIGASKLRLSSQ